MYGSARAAPRRDRGLFSAGYNADLLLMSAWLARGLESVETGLSDKGRETLEPLMNAEKHQ